MKIRETIVAIALFMAVSTFASAQSVANINSTEVKEFLKQNSKSVILDVRTPDEFNSGHIENAINLDARNPEIITKINNLNKDAKYLVYCRTNNRSSSVTDYMIKNGFKDVTKINDGIVGLNSNQIPLVK